MSPLRGWARISPGGTTELLEFQFRGWAHDAAITLPLSGLNQRIAAGVFGDGAELLQKERDSWPRKTREGARKLESLFASFGAFCGDPFPNPHSLRPELAAD